MDQLQEHQIDVKRGFHYRYYISSPSQADSTKPAILLCHGWPDSAHLWKNVVPHLLSSKHRLVIPDLLGYGGTSKPTDPKDFEISAMVADVLEIFDAEHIQSPIVPLGHDWGAYFAQRLYMLNNKRMAGLITLNVAWMPPRKEPFDLTALNDYTEKHIGYPIYAYWELFTDPDGPNLIDQHLESVWYAIHGDDNEWMKKLFCTRGAFKDWLEKDRKDIALKPFARDNGVKSAWIEGMKTGGFTAPCCWYRALKEDYNLETERAINPRIDKPYLFIGCDGDAVCRTDAIEQGKHAGMLEELEVHEIHSGHWCPLEKPDEVAHLVLKWLEKQDFAG